MADLSPTLNQNGDIKSNGSQPNNVVPVPSIPSQTIGLVAMPLLQQSGKVSY